MEEYIFSRIPDNKERHAFLLATLAGKKNINRLLAKRKFLVDNGGFHLNSCKLLQMAVLVGKNRA